MNNIDVKVSVIIPVYNVEKYLEQCIETVMSQTLKDIEIICIDDGSTDASLEILKKYEADDSRIRVYSKPNAGYGHTINYGLDRSRGKYISIIESDDFIDKKNLEALFECAEMRGADYVRSNYYQFFDGKDHLNEELDLFTYDEPLSAFEDYRLFLLMPCMPWGCIYLRSFLNTNNIRMNETPGASYQDASWTFITLLKAEKIVFLRDAFYHYRMDNMNSSIHSSRNVFCMMDEINYIKQKIKEYQISDPNIFLVFVRYIYNNYKAEYNRISDEFQYAFLSEWKKEILIQQSKGWLIKDLFDEDQWAEITNILSDMDGYFDKTAKAYLMRDVYASSINCELYCNAFIDKILHCKIIIFGTGDIAKEIVCFLQEKDKIENIFCFCETKPTKRFFYEKEVVSIRDVPCSKETLLVCATLEITQKSVIPELKKAGFTNIICIDKTLRQSLRSIYHIKRK